MIGAPPYPEPPTKQEWLKKRAFLQQYVLNRTMVNRCIVGSEEVREADLAWNEIEKLVEGEPQ